MLFPKLLRNCANQATQFVFGCYTCTFLSLFVSKAKRTGKEPIRDLALKTKELRCCHRHERKMEHQWGREWHVNGVWGGSKGLVKPEPQFAPPILDLLRAFSKAAKKQTVCETCCDVPRPHLPPRLSFHYPKVHTFFNVTTSFHLCCSTFTFSDHTNKMTCARSANNTGQFFSMDCTVRPLNTTSEQPGPSDSKLPLFRGGGD